MTNSDSFARLTVGDFVDRLASAEPVPGGGSASAIAGSLAAALLAMVCRLSLDRPKYEQYRASLEAALDAGDRARQSLIQLADEDARAYSGYMQARRMPRESGEEQAARDSAVRDAARQSSQAPLEVVRVCASLMEFIGSIAGRSNLNAASDLEVAARLVAAAARGAAANVTMNLPSVGDESFTGTATAEVGGLVQGIERELLVISERVAAGTLREPQEA